MSEPEGQTPNDSAAAPRVNISLDEIAGAAQIEVATSEADESLVIAEKETLEAAKLKIENDRLKDELEEARDLHGIRKEYIGKLYALIKVWLIVVVVFLILSASQKKYFDLSDSVIIAFITSTTVSVLGLFLLVAKWLYPSSHKDESNSKK